MGMKNPTPVQKFTYLEPDSIISPLFVQSVIAVWSAKHNSYSKVELRRCVRSREHQLGTREGCSGVVLTTTWAPALVGIVAFSSIGALSVVKTVTDLLASAGAKL